VAATDEIFKAECLPHPGCPWSEELIELNCRMEQLESSHQTLARLTKDAYQHSQQTFLTVRAIEDKVNGLLADAERGAVWRREAQELQAAMAKMLSTVAEAVK